MILETRWECKSVKQFQIFFKELKLNKKLVPMLKRSSAVNSIVFLTFD